MLGYLDPDNFLGGRARLDFDAADKALVENVGRPLGLPPVEAAYGVYKVICTTIAEGIRLMSVQRGVDPRQFTMLGFGGASGLHAAEVARQTASGKRVHSGVRARAVGLRDAQFRHQVRFLPVLPCQPGPVGLGRTQGHSGGIGEARAGTSSLNQGVSPDAVEMHYSADMRYLDQIYEVTVPLPDPSLPDQEFLSRWASNFHQRYEELYSYSQQDQEVRLITLRVTAVGRLPRIAQPDRAGDTGATSPLGSRRVFLGEWHEAPAYSIDTLPVGAEIHGPAVLESDFTTVLVWPGDTAVH